MDFAGPFGPLSNKVNNYAMVYVDNFSRFTFITSCNSNSAAVAIRVLGDRIFPITGSPEVLIIDGAGAFVSDKFEEFAKALNIELDMIAPENHRANGLAERQVRVLNDAMRQLSNTDKAKWPSYLRDIQVSIASTPSDDTGISPYEMWTGYPMRRPDLKSVEVPLHPALDAEAPRMMTRLQRALARAHEEEAAKEPRRPYHRKPFNFKVGDRVRLKLPQNKRVAVDRSTGQPHTYAKWVGAWLTPLEIVEDLGYDQFQLLNPRTGKLLKRSAEQITPEEA